jgi:hypothetical protein
MPKDDKPQGMAKRQGAAGAKKKAAKKAAKKR